ncbi:radical SAM protein [Candidatus Woesearchaeota archaeon]|nr:radical SAM protein [Candidatus Woesearchaeota archaeon]
MTLTLLVYPPFCTPAGPPYSIANLHAFLSNNLPKTHNLAVLDLNLEFHKRRFPEEALFSRSFSEGGDYDRDRYDSVINKYKKVTEQVYSASNKSVVQGQLPEMFDEMLNNIIGTTGNNARPDIVAFSIVYSSQAFYALALINALKRQGIRTVIGGPAVNEKLRAAADTALANELELLNYIAGSEANHDALDFHTVLDFNIFPLGDYFSPEPVIPLRASNTCFYQKCAFCTHHTGGIYMEFPISNIVESIQKSDAKSIFIVDDMLHRKRLLNLAEALKPLNVKWMCQLKPTADLDGETLKILEESGLRMVLWGVESASDRILTLMNKGTNSADITKVLKDSHDAGIVNVLFIMLGFPTETKEEAKHTLDWLEQNKEAIDLISTSIFGLQKNTPIYNDPERFGITKILEEKRTVLDNKITYEVSSGMTSDEANRFRSHNIRRIDRMNRYPRTMNFFREHMLGLLK